MIHSYGARSPKIHECLCQHTALEMSPLLGLNDVCIVFLLFLEGDNLHIYIYMYVYKCRPLKKETSSQSLQDFWGRCLFCFKKRRWIWRLVENMVAQTIWGQDSWTKSGARFSKDMPGSSVTKRGSNHWKAGPGWDPGEGSGKQSYTMCVYYIYRYVQYTFD